MKKGSKSKYLVGGEYFVPSRNGVDRQMARARWELIKVVGQLVPSFFQLLHDDVYPVFVRVLKSGPDSQRGTTRYDPTVDAAHDPTVDAALRRWSQRFNVGKEEWILAGARETLVRWHRHKSPHLAGDLKPNSLTKDSTPICGFHVTVAEAGIADASHMAEHQFKFEDSGWDPLAMSLPGWRSAVTENFEKALKSHEREALRLAKERKFVKTAGSYSPDHFEWLALSRFGSRRHAQIQCLYVADGGTSVSEATISKGILRVSKLAGLTPVRNAKRT